MGWQPIEIFGTLVFAHCLADYPLQGDFLARAKNHKNPIAGVPFWQALFAHSIIHAGFVGLITGLWWLAVAEFVMHTAIDYVKCDDPRFTFNHDQAIHILCKIVWCFLFFAVSP